MKIIPMIQFEEEDGPDIRRITEWANEEMSFFVEREPGSLANPERGEEGDGHRPIRRLSAGHPLTLEHLGEALTAIVKAWIRVGERVPDQFFPQELKDQYLGNLMAAQTIVGGWINKAMER